PRLAGRRAGPGRGCSASDLAETPGRTLRCGTAARACSAGPPHPAARSSDGEALAALVATTLQGLATRSRLHACAEPVRTGALALLGLVSAFHRSRSRG